MTYTANGYVRDYSASSDTATVELVGIGIIDTWLDGCKISAGVNRAYLVSGVEVTLTVPDAHRLCEALIVGIGAGNLSAANASTVQGFQQGRAKIQTNGSGAGSVTVFFSPAYSVAPQVYAGSDLLLPVHIGLPTTTQFTLSLSAGTAPANTTVYCSWSALGGA